MSTMNSATPTSRPSDRVLGSYAWTNPAEFFAVATERFFCRPGARRGQARRSTRCPQHVLPAGPGRRLTDPRRPTVRRAREEIRTPDLLFTRQLLCQLSYPGGRLIVPASGRIGFESVAAHRPRGRGVLALGYPSEKDARNERVTVRGGLPGTPLAPARRPPTMSAPRHSSGSGFGSSAGGAAVRGAVVIGIALVIGFLLLQQGVGDDDLLVQSESANNASETGTTGAATGGARGTETGGADTGGTTPTTDASNAGSLPTAPPPCRSLPAPPTRSRSSWPTPPASTAPPVGPPSSSVRSATPRSPATNAEEAADTSTLYFAEGYDPEALVMASRSGSIRPMSHRCPTRFRSANRRPTPIWSCSWVATWRNRPDRRCPPSTTSWRVSHRAWTGPRSSPTSMARSRPSSIGPMTPCWSTAPNPSYARLAEEPVCSPSSRADPSPTSSDICPRDRCCRVCTGSKRSAAENGETIRRPEPGARSSPTSRPPPRVSAPKA